MNTAHDFESEVQRMCDLSSVIENKARDEGIPDEKWPCLLYGSEYR